MTKEKLAEICFHCGVSCSEDLDRVDGDWKQFSYSLDNLEDKKYIVISPLNSFKVEYEIKGENDLAIVEDVVKTFETNKDEDEEWIEIFDVKENKFLNYDVKMEKTIGVKWTGYVA